jgi:hypothetical protein
MTITARRFSALLLACAALIAAALFLRPVPVEATAGTLVNIVDPSTSAKAKVSASGRLLTAPCDTDSCAATNGNRLQTDAFGIPAQPLDTINDLTLHSGDTRRPMFAGLGNRKIALTSIITSAEGSTAGSVELLVIAYVKSNSSSGDCETLSGFGAAERFTIMVPVGQTVNLNFPSPLIWTQYADSNDYYCIDVESFGGPTGYTVHFSAYGFRN